MEITQNTANPTRRMTIGDFLFRRLDEAGVRHLFGVPGDYTSFSLLGLRLPPGCTFIGSINWGSIGYSVGALLGALTAAPERRHVLLIGDGSFQVAAQELSTILHHDHKPAILLINNGGYTIERGYLGKTEPYNDIANWAYAELPKVLHPGASVSRSWRGRAGICKMHSPRRTTD